MSSDDDDFASGSEMESSDGGSMDMSDGMDEISGLSDEDDVRGKEAEFAYEILTPEEVMAKPLQMIEEVNDVLQVHPMLARQVLQYFHWNKENAVQRYFSEQEKIFREAQLPRPEDLTNLADLPNKVDCSVCFDTCAKKDVDALPCGHVFCKLCWRDYLTQRVRHEGKARIQCMNKDCHLMMDELSVLRLMDNEDGKKLYTKIAAKEFVREMKGLRFCPGNDCELAVRAEVSQPREVHCKCGHRFCFQCGLAHHRPAPCSVMKQWEAKSGAEGDNLAFLSKKSRNCPKCTALIIKDQGCQYVRCNCGHAFCWICLANVDHKAHNCNKFTQSDPNSERNEWNRYTFYYERYKGHADAKKYEPKLQAKAEQIMKQLTEGGMNWIDAQFIKTAVEALRKARAVLAVSYAMGYFMDAKSNAELFELQQGLMEEACERLAAVLEDKKGDLTGPESRLQTVNLTENLLARLSNFEHAKMI